MRSDNCISIIIISIVYSNDDKNKNKNKNKNSETRTVKPEQWNQDLVTWEPGQIPART